jgi:nitrogen fixation protein FixH
VRRALLLLAGLAGAACGEPRSSDADLVFSVAVSPTPAMVGPGRVLVTLSDRTGAPIEGATVVLSGRPPAGDPVLDTAREQAPGSYAAAAFPFAAPGEWTLEASARLPDGREASARHPIRVVGRPTPP